MTTLDYYPAHPVAGGGASQRNQEGQMQRAVVSSDTKILDGARHALKIPDSVRTR